MFVTILMLNFFLIELPPTLKEKKPVILQFRWAYEHNGLYAQLRFVLLK